MKGVEGIAEVTKMRILSKGIRMMKRLPGLPSHREVPAKNAEPVRKNELVMASIARTYPELIVMASEFRGIRP